MPSSSPPPPTKPVVPDLRPWSPPADPDKPPCPYRTGFTVDIKSHVPPAPFGGRDYGPGRRPMVSQLDLRTLKQTEIVMGNPPLETEEPPVPLIHTLSVARDLAVVDGRGAQLALCTIKPKGPVGHDPIEAVAKIYDPLYYSFPHPDVPSVPCDVTRFAEQDYAREALTYEHLQAIGQAGSFAPKYFGSWTFTVGLQMGKTTPPQSRSVRLILIEYISGKSIRELCAGSAPAAATFSEAYRLEVLAKILDGEAKLRFTGIDQQDLAARNVVIQAPTNPHDQTAAQPDTIPRVVLIDYNFAVVAAETTHKRVRYAGTTLPPNPMRIYWNSWLEEFGSWIPAAWETNPRLRQEWLKKRFGGDNLARYAPIGEELEFAAPPPPRARQPLTRELAKFPVNFWGDAAGDAVTGCNGGKRM